MIQALALELFWNRFQSSEYLWQGGWTAAIDGLQLTVMLLGILQIWLFYISLMLRFSWLPSMADTLVPFGIGLLEFSMIDLMGPATLGPWFIGLGALFGICIGVTHLAHRRARRDPANDYFFSKVAPAGWKDYLASIAVVTILLLFGAALWQTGNRTWLPLIALLFGVLALAYQLLLTKRYWIHTPVQEKPGTQDIAGNSTGEFWQSRHSPALCPLYSHYLIPRRIGISSRTRILPVLSSPHRYRREERLRSSTSSWRFTSIV
ncbi:MAG: hypothetical protein O7F73_04745 [Gammaproteobacteria bacterium]|nr:hypothetical protein [Gammaproteobacteria bacterium]